MSAASGRLKKELAEVGKIDKSSGVSASAVGDDLRHLKGKINGPETTCYEGGIFEIDIHIPKQYPFEPPKVGSYRIVQSRLWLRQRASLERPMILTIKLLLLVFNCR